MNRRAALLTAMIRAEQEAFWYARLAAQATDLETADDAILLRETALDLAQERLNLALGLAADGGAL